MSYAGDVTPDVAWRMLRDDPRVVLIDVRTEAEWAYVGTPVLKDVGKTLVCVQWQTYPEGRINPNFTAEVKAKGYVADQPLLFLCRSGARSKAAAIAMTSAGFSQCYNVAEGFEGDRNADNHRGTVGGWKARKLPWGQT